ncbi:MAG: SRPBCC family protein [Pseudomonadota bacterium]
MKFSTREDVEAPIEATFDMLCDFENYERQALRRGAEVRRTDTRTSAGVGMRWQAQFVMRGRPRDLSLEMIEFQRPDVMGLTFESGGLTGTFQVDCLALSKTRTRINLAIELAPQTLSARLLVQSLKLAKTSLNKRFKLRVAEYAKQMEDRYQAQA